MTLIGIDLGTTNSAIATLDQVGSPEIIKNREGDNMTPSFIFIDPDSEGTAIVGKEAKAELHIHPDCVFHSFKRHMSRPDLITVGKTSSSPAELSSLVIKKLLRDAAEKAGAIAGAIISVPANFSNEERTATLEAGKQAGLSEVHLINEPTAALFYYSYKKPVIGTVAVYDFGGGTLDVTIANVRGKDVEITTSKGDSHLGGIDFDKQLLKIITDKLFDETQEVYDANTHQFNRTVEEYKMQLSVREMISVQVSGGAIGRKIIKVSRTEFEAATKSLIERANMLVESALHEAGLAVGDIQDVYLVGGSSRMPMVINSLTALFEKPPVCYINPDEVVALGAALYAGFKNPNLNAAQQSALQSLRLQEVANHYFGTITIDDTNPYTIVASVSNIIKKNTPIPCSVTRSFYTSYPGQTEVRCDVTQSSSHEIDPDFVKIIWEGNLGPFPPDRDLNKEIKITFSYDADQIMRCKFLDVESGISKEVDLNMNNKSDNNSDAGLNNKDNNGDINLGDFLIE